MPNRSICDEDDMELSFNFTWKKTPELDQIYLTPQPMYNWSKIHAKSTGILGRLGLSSLSTYQRCVLNTRIQILTDPTGTVNISTSISKGVLRTLGLSSLPTYQR